MNQDSIDKLVTLLKSRKLYKKKNSKNIIAICPKCGDHPKDSKKGHLYVSLNPELPLCHCFYSGCTFPITKLIFDLSGDKNLVKELIPHDNLKTYQENKKKVTVERNYRFIKFKIPKLDSEKFKLKTDYINTRCNNSIDVSKIPNLIFDIKEFFRINEPLKDFLNILDIDYIHDNFVAFLGTHCNTLFCRNIDSDSKYKFKKIKLQEDKIDFLEYWKIDNNPRGDIIVLAEGNFDILGEYVSDSIGIKHRVKSYFAGGSFSYSSLLKSICFDESLYKCNIVVLSDRDKEPFWYNKFQTENSHIIETIKIYYNKTGKDFGVFPQVPIEFKETKNLYKNKTKIVSGNIKD